MVPTGGVEPPLLPCHGSGLPLTYAGWSGRRDLNARSPVPQTGGDSRLPYAPLDECPVFHSMQKLYDALVALVRLDQVDRALVVEGRMFLSQEQVMVFLGNEPIKELLDALFSLDPSHTWCPS